MNFDFDDTQYALRDLSRELFARESPASRLRALWDGKPFDRTVWRTMAEAGLTGITVPEAFGGAGGDELDLALVYEEAGRTALPEPLLETTGIAAPLIAHHGSDELRERWLPAIASGDAIVAVQGPADGWAAWASEADLLVAPAGGALHALPRERFRATPVPSLDPSRPLCTVEIDGGPDTLIGAGEGDEPMAGAGRRAAFGAASILNGLSMRMLDDTVAYVGDRVQFGRPVGSFQAVKHKLASMHVAIASSRPAAWYAAYAVARGTDAALAASTAKIAAARTEELCAREALQCHGGIGFTWEHDLHLWMKRGVVMRSAYGTPAMHRDVLRAVATATDDPEGT